MNRIAEREKLGLLIITHYSKILSFVKPQFVHVMVDGKIVADGGHELIEKLEKEATILILTRKVFRWNDST